VVLNLVSNAARFTEHGGITINLTRRAQHVVVEVADTGPGIGPEDAASIFEPFCQGASNIWRDKGGSGLGLSISQQFVKLHQGRMWLESEPEVGSSFYFELPISPPVERAPTPGRWIRGDWVWREDSFRTDQALAPEGPPKPRVVVCDQGGGLASEFERFGDVIELVRADGLKGTLEEAQDCMANVVVLNAPSSRELPALLEEARRLVPTTPLIGCSVPPAAQTAVAVGAAGYLVKPVSAEDLRMVLESTGRRVQRVLVVDDDPDAVALFCQMLRLCDGGLQIESALSGERAMEKLSERPYDLVLLDVLMPGLDGWQLMDRLHANGWHGRPSIYFVSAQDPADRPPTSGLLLATVGEGLSIVKLLRCSLELARLMLTPDGALDPMPPPGDGAQRASTGSTPLPEPVPAPPL
jgi:CheY-like chemotaxis protein